MLLGMDKARDPSKHQSIRDGSCREEVHRVQVSLQQTESLDIFSKKRLEQGKLVRGHAGFVERLHFVAFF